MQTATSSAIEARGLTKRFGDVMALDGLDLTVETGTVLGLLGPNGAGKTTAVSILTTLMQPDSGTATIAGVDLATHPQLVRERIGLSGQYAAVDEVLTGRENLDMIGRLYHLGKVRSKARADELLERFDLADAGDRPVKGYSGGMRRRLDLAGALVAQPPVLFLDEPTTGLDPRSRIELWDVIRELVSDGSTLLLTTQYLEEADQLADEIVVIDAGRGIARGTADELKSQVGGERLELVVADEADVDQARQLLARHAPSGAAADVEVKTSTRTLLCPISSGIDTLAAVISDLRSESIAVSDIGLRRPTLDDVFLTLTGHGTVNGASGDAAAEQTHTAGKERS
ncbi:MAG: ATP-binding cassette domain-containing protein [Ilumatobacter sp.]|uniref:ATP-binding cassette domain-containing protein n=1 Tax=Ilumatobacter sp. TaxID=1967498 RepID=UPI0032981CA0